ncbi:sensor histidine kinase [Sphingomonas sp. TDK1]|uniref:sensor histidine kinase n=1 Tax=Sphingomonas sp. TDK1 TaxID=453247 RepID=UPI0007D9864B|nr:ATP-binding protein [Sphingomonas sp. TDK1]OAN65611.1 histidine kinase [Sphingomonas sp. TDK1]
MRRRRLQSLGRIAIGFALSVSVATALVGVGVYLALLDAIDRQVDLRLQGEARELLEGGVEVPEIARRIVRESSERESADIGFLLLTPQGAVIAGNISPATPLPLGVSTVKRNAAIPGLSRGRAWVTRLRGGETLALIAESEPIDQHDYKRGLILATGFGALLGILLLGTMALIRAIRVNIAAIRGTAEAIIDGDMSARVPVERPNSVFGGLAVTFNRMLDRIGELMGGMRSISNDVAHDLRTPMSRLHGRLAALADAPEAAPVRDELAGAVAESEEILALFAAILRITEIEGGERRNGFVPLDLAGLAGDVGEGLALMVTESGRGFRVAIPAEPLPIEGDPRLLTQVIVNLVENAVTHTPRGTSIRLEVLREGDAALLRVEDNGRGIPPEDRARALRRFGRLDASRQVRGYGLGLPLVAAVARLHRGELTLEDAMPGLRVQLRLKTPDSPRVILTAGK